MNKLCDTVPRCPKELPANILAAVEVLAKSYLQSFIRPKLTVDVLNHWDSLVDCWADSDLPLFIRKQSLDIGMILNHAESSRKLAPCDNSPAHWAVITAFARGTQVTLQDIRTAIDAHEIPVTMAMSNAEIQSSAMKGVLAKCRGVNAGEYGWKVDHIQEIGLRQRRRVQELPIENLKHHFKLLMKPSNMVLVPSQLKGLGDLPGFLHLIAEELDLENPKNGK
ncbi:MAG: hypothetical protein JWM16_2310 [Verrucomicrobiales bacterium]|nr:hypothetical protein [Verrucomicrobiales bacterium]